jgi:hypothetical protein
MDRVVQRDPTAAGLGLIAPALREVRQIVSPLASTGETGSLRRIFVQRLILCAILCGSLAGALHAQGPRGYANVSKEQSTLAGASAGSAWIGSQVFYTIGGTNDPADNLLVSASGLFEINLGNSPIRLPVLGNFGQLYSSAADTADGAEKRRDQKAQQLMLSASGLNVGLYPYWVPMKWGNGAVTIHGSVMGKINAFGDTAETRKYLPSGKVSLGIELSLGDQTKPREDLLLSLSPTWTLFDSDDYNAVFGQKRASVNGFEATMVIPVGKGFGVLIESLAGKGMSPAIRGALLYAREP